MDNRLKQRIRRRLDYPDARIRGRLATDSTGPYATRAGYMRVEVQKSATEFLPPVEARNDTAAHQAGTFVNLIEEDGELVIYRVDTAQEVARGANPMLTGGQNQDAFSYITTDQLSDFRTIETAPPGAEVFIMPGFLADGTYFPGGVTTTLTTLVSGLTSGYHMLACTFITSGGGVEVQNSAEQSQLDPLGADDLAECISAASDGAIPSKAIRLYSGQTSVTKDDFKYDIRQIVNALGGGSGGGSGEIGNPNPISSAVSLSANRQLVYHSQLTIADGGSLTIGSGSELVILAG